MPVSQRTSRRLAVAATCVVSMLLAGGLAWWQWDRYTSATGTLQNLGYVLQWPAFGLFPAFMFWRIRRLRERQEAEDAGDAENAAVVPVPRAGPETAPSVPRMSGKDSSVVEGEADEELAAYNRYLAELNARDESGR